MSPKKDTTDAFREHTTPYTIFISVNLKTNKDRPYNNRLCCSPMPFGMDPDVFLSGDLTYQLPLVTPYSYKILPSTITLHHRSLQHTHIQNVESCTHLS